MSASRSAMMAAASATSSIPRFLLPQYGLIWRRANFPRPARPGQQQLLRHASTKAPGKGSKPIVLEKPAKFVPPSHGSRLPKKGTPRHYGGDLSAAEVQTQKTKDYPGLMAPEGSWAHWFWNSRSLHLVLTLGTLTGLAAFTFMTNFRRTSPFADMAPSLSEFGSHPIASMRRLVEVVKLSESHRSAEVAEKRKRRVDDVVRRSEYRKAHGLDKEDVVGGWTAKTDSESLGPALPVGGGTSHAETEGKRKKWLGIF